MECSVGQNEMVDSIGKRSDGGAETTTSAAAGNSGRKRPLLALASPLVRAGILAADAPPRTEERSDERGEDWVEQKCSSGMGGVRLVDDIRWRGGRSGGRA